MLLTLMQQISGRDDKLTQQTGLLDTLQVPNTVLSTGDTET